MSALAIADQYCNQNCMINVQGQHVTKKTKQLSRSEVVGEIRERILKGDLVPGQRLVEAEICELLNTSRGTARSALMDLDHEGLIERIANRGARVRVVSLTEALQIVEVRQVVEALCVSQAAEKVTDLDIEELRAMAKELRACAKTSDIVGYAQCTQSIFEAYIRIADQPVAADILSRLRSQSTRHRYRLTYRAGRAQVSLPFWLEIIDAICRRRPAEAAAALHRLVENIKESMKAIASEDVPFATVYSNS
jgi:DNA-binding GntR family transcriptional regulator